ncbi:uncharacterized protein PHALS_07766 [Plasmopara halstedii]|uniref:Uncharacterized protein n=1 Tax=Plasmopara halstedii TaxID=4781 RepID=A0A0P1B5E9_PLAHL|nr:uncharacterized protein PHALS_07766 [Plasmopara halstedii]CEG50036.1 hypothetical protein PHALS_07766 [Plasmopara halstedii]|eukprot:XP_024586405.1 hypothetical protein PHALS_07766 [Plasmopara halstedii]
MAALRPPLFTPARVANLVLLSTKNDTTRASEPSTSRIKQNLHADPLRSPHIPLRETFAETKMLV